jgi:alginate O-acetyltransferase complex protein AlgI
MLFSSPIFFLFFAAYFLLHIFTPLKYRSWLIIVGSTFFYASWRIEYVVVPYVLMVAAFFGTAWMVRAQDQFHRRVRLALTLILLFTPLFTFKYTGFVVREILAPLIDQTVTLPDMPLPLGISFVTFTMTAYVVDIYRGVFAANTPFRIVLAYVLFFPHLIAGPILKPHELIPQLENLQRSRFRHARTAILIFTVGLVKKIIFADQIATVVDRIYAGGSYTAADALLAVYGFAVQIYCDFSGYTDMAIGLAMLLGVRLPNNFLRPYAASSLTEFWRCWHITLSFWLRDYLYIPLGGNRGSALIVVRNIMITMVLGGLWHGANWTFVIWGTIHGLGIAFLHLLRRTWKSARLPLPSSVGIFLTFNFVTAAWVFFRAPDFHAAVGVFSTLVNGSWPAVGTFLTANVFFIGLMIVFFLGHKFDDHRYIKAGARYMRAELFWPLVTFLWVLVISIGQASSAKFIYFDF